MSLLAGSVPLKADAIAYPMLLVATATLGLGFGLTLGSISTYAGAFMPDRRDVALTALNVLLGLGTALSPFLISLFTKVGQWWYLPSARRRRPYRTFLRGPGSAHGAARAGRRRRRPAPNKVVKRDAGTSAWSAHPDFVLGVRRRAGHLRDRRDDVRQLGDHLACQQRASCRLRPRTRWPCSGRP